MCATNVGAKCELVTMFLPVLLYNICLVSSLEQKDGADSYQNVVNDIQCFFFILLADSSLRVKDAIKEFQPRGRLAQHSFGEVSRTMTPSKQQDAEP